MVLLFKNCIGTQGRDIEMFQGVFRHPHLKYLPRNVNVPLPLTVRVKVRLRKQGEGDVLVGVG